LETGITVTRHEKAEVYREIIPQIQSLIAGESDWIANLANVSSALKYAFPDRISWVGFYLMRTGELVLGPFQGKPACVRIASGRGVCGTAAKECRTIIVPDVRAYPGHIACDPDSRSEIVVPMPRDGKLLGVLDLDSATEESFDEVDSKHLNDIIERLVAVSAHPGK